MFNSIYSNGLNTNMLAMYPFIGGTAGSHKFNAINPVDTDGAYRLTFAGGWTHSASGATPNGTNGVAETYVNPSVTSFTLSGGSMGVYCGTNGPSGAAMGGIGNSGGADVDGWVLYPGLTNPGTLQEACFFWKSSSGVFNGSAIADTLGLMSIGRTGTTQVQLYRRGVLLSSPTFTSNSVTNNTLALGARNTLFGTPAEYSTYRQQFTYIHRGLTPSQMIILNDIIQTYQESLGRNVYSTGLPEANAYLSAVVAAGGTGITSTVSAATRTLFTSLVSNNLYDKIDIMYPLIGGTSASCAIEAKGNTGNTITFFGGITFNTSGMTGNAVNGYGTTKYLPFRTNNHIGYYLGTNTDNGFRTVSGIQFFPSGGEIQNYINVGGNSTFRNGTAGGTLTIAYNSSNWYYINTWEVGVGARVYSNGSLSGSIAGGATAGSYTGTTGIGAPGLMRTDGLVGEYNGQRIQFLHSGTGLSAAEALTLNTIINTFQTSLGRNRY
jgi:hypothetical protein